jgi:nitroreductase
MERLMQSDMTAQREGDAERFAAALRARRSINLFEPQTPPDALLLDAIETARWAPNHRLTEPWRFYLLGSESREAVAQLAADIDAAAKGERAGLARLQRMKSIPGLLVLTARRSADALLEREDYAACCCAAQNLMLYLWQVGVGSKWTTGAVTRDARFYELLGIDAAAESVVGLYWYGYPKLIPGQQRRAVAEIAMVLP